MRLRQARAQWRGLAGRMDSDLRFIEVRCSDEAEHRRRLDGRQRQIDGFPEPTWASVQVRRAGFEDWRDERLVVDSMAPLDDNVGLALEYLADERSAAQARHR